MAAWIALILFMLFEQIYPTSASDPTVNCHGSAMCHSVGIPGHPILRFRDLLDIGLNDVPGGPAPPDTYYHTGRTIACQEDRNFDGALCLYIQGTHVPFHGINATVIVEKLGLMAMHGCRVCGSIDLTPFKSSMYRLERDRGILTVNYVTKNICHGMCEWHGYQGKTGQFPNEGIDCVYEAGWRWKCMPSYYDEDK